VGKPKRKRPLGSYMWVDNIKMDLREMRWGDMDLMELAQNRDQWKARVNMVINFWVS
jgi:hypothetical protein